MGSEQAANATAALPVLGAYAPASSAVREGELIAFEIRRSGTLEVPCSVHWAVAPRDAGDIGGRIGGTALFGNGLDRVTVTVQTLDRQRSQGSRRLALQLSDPAGCWLDSDRLQALVTILDGQAPTPEPSPEVWWKPGPFNGRPWASGPFHWSYQWLLRYGREVALPSAICCNASGAGENRAATWELMAGGPRGQPEVIQPGSQLDWSNRNATNWAAAWAYMPKNHGIMSMAYCMIPLSHRSDRQPESWGKIAQGEFDQYYRDLGTRLARLHEKAGRYLRHWFGRPNHEMNQSNIYQVRAENRKAYKAAMERAFALMREGAGYPLRWCHAPAPTDWIGPFDDWIPGNCDAIAMSYHPAKTVVDRASWEAFMQGTPGKRYGFHSDLIGAADRYGKPIAFPEWSPKYEDGRGCPIADQVYEWTYQELFTRYQDRLVCECVHHRNTLIKGAYQDSQPGAAEAWNRGVDVYKRLWGGAKAD
ncbi:MAG: hypothetical protein AB7I59_10805 [Geminicoccaceae bacterium]